MRVLMIIIIFVLLFNIQAFSNNYNTEIENTNQSVFDILNITEDQIDIGHWALIIANECDSTVNINQYLKKLDNMVSEIYRMIAGRDGDMLKFIMTKMFLYDTGQWNNYQPFLYDLDDPMGKENNSQLLSYYIDNKKGNCVSMPTLFISLMERVDPDIQFFGSTAPLHLFCRMYDRQSGDLWNVEATNGGTPARDEWYSEQFHITQTAIDSGLYLSTLTKKEYVGELIGTIVSKYRSEGQYEKALEYNELRLKINPNSATGLVQQGALFGWIGHTKQENILRQNRKPTEKELKELKLYKKESDRYIDIALSKGWRQTTPEEEAEYLDRIQKEKDKIIRR